MAVRPSEPKQGKVSAAAVLLLAGLFAGPVCGAPNHEIICDDAHDATLEISSDELTASTVSHELENDDVAAEIASEMGILPQGHALKPNVEAAVRDMFTDSEKDSAAHDVNEAQESDTAVIMNTRVPGISDDQLARIKRQMFRKDI
jgi:hypothetical protein